jgi:hypothetical protein
VTCGESDGGRNSWLLVQSRNVKASGLRINQVPFKTLLARTALPSNKPHGEPGKRRDRNLRHDESTRAVQVDAAPTTCLCFLFSPFIASIALIARLNTTCCSCTLSPATGGRFRVNPVLKIT